MKILIACEKSQIVTNEFRKLGHEAYSNDIDTCTGNNIEWHIQEDCRIIIKKHTWDMIIMHPPCTYTALSGNRWYSDTIQREKGIKLTVEIYELARSKCNKTVLEQPMTVLQKYIGKKSQSIQPWQFGHGETKTTWLWINGLPLLKPTNIVQGREENIWKMPPGPHRQELRSITYPGIAKAMAEQWGK